MTAATADLPESLHWFTDPKPDRATRRAAGKAVRASVPLEGHADVGPADGRDPVGVLRAQEDDREPGLVPLRYERMTVSPFTFLRGAAAVMAADLGRTASSGLGVQLCGDAHVANFGMFASPDRRLVFDLNDFDETLPGPFEWDVKRLATSVVVAGRDVGVGAKAARRAAVATVESYRTTTRTLSGLPPLEVWYARLDVSQLVRDLKGTGLAGSARKASRKSLLATGSTAVAKLTEVVGGHRRFRSDPPLLVPVDESVLPGATERAATLFRGYLDTVPRDVAVLLARFAFVGLAHKVVGVGSVGTRALLLLLQSGNGQELVLQVKQAQESVLAAHLPSVPGEFTRMRAGERVVTGQRLMQATGDPFLGWTSGESRPRRDYYVRQLKDMKGSIDLGSLDAGSLDTYGRLCGAVLARAHARAGDPARVAGYLGSSAVFDEAVADFAVAYADRTVTDHAALAAARAAGLGSAPA
jgi:uncharacterized protein (DUF2252 family)